MFLGAVRANPEVGNWQITTPSLTNVVNMSAFCQDAVSFQQDLCDTWGPIFRNVDTDTSSTVINLDLAFYGSACPENVTLPDLTVSPPGPLCFACGDNIDDTEAEEPPLGSNDAWQVLGWGDCLLENDENDDPDCIASHDGVGVSEYAAYTACGFRALRTGTLVVDYFFTESNFDWLSVRLPHGSGGLSSQEELRFSGQVATGLSNRLVEAGTDILWETDSTEAGYGWRLCLR